MMPSLIWEVMADSQELGNLGITPDRIIEAQSIDTRPFNDGYFIVVSFEEELPALAGLLAPRTVIIAVHSPWDDTRDFAPLTRILNLIDKVILPIESQYGEDGVRVSQVRRSGRSGNLSDEGWRTITRTATYGVSYDESAV